MVILEDGNLKSLWVALEENNLVNANELLTQCPRLVNMLVDYKLDDNSFKWAPLHSAAFSGQCEMVQLLLHKGADLNITDTWNGSHAVISIL
jgi:ankyrin repeat protein